MEISVILCYNMQLNFRILKNKKGNGMFMYDKRTFGEIYMEEMCPHIKMRKKLTKGK